MSPGSPSISLTPASLDSIPPHFLILLKWKYPRAQSLYTSLSQPLTPWPPLIMWLSLWSVCWTSPDLSTDLLTCISNGTLDNFTWMFERHRKQSAIKQTPHLSTKTCSKYKLSHLRQLDIFSGSGQTPRIYPCLCFLYHIPHRVCNRSCHSTMNNWQKKKISL